MAENKTKPDLRFRGFTDEWEQRKLSSMATEVNRNDPESTAPVMMITANNGFIDQSDRYAFNNAGKSLKKYILLKKYEMAYNHGASKLRPYGSCFALTSAENARIPFVYHCFSVGNNDPEFISMELNGSRAETQLRKIVSSGARMDGLLNISYEEYTAVELVVPSVAEQKKLSDYFRQVDNLITLHQRKYEKLVNLKKSMLEKMFPQNGSAYPEIRFSGFTAPWEQRKLGELGTLKNGMNFSKDAMGIGFPFVNLQDIFGKNQINEENLGKAMASPRQLRDYNLIEGDVLFVRSSVKLEGVGEAALVPKSLKNTTYSGFIIRFRDEIGLDNNFKRFIFSTEDVRKQMVSQATDSANKNISQTVLSNLEFFLPKREEQIAIGAFLSSIDNLITLHQSKLEKLKNLKKSMLQRMFV